MCILYVCVRDVAEAASPTCRFCTVRDACGAAGRTFYLSDLLYLGSALPDQRTALAGWNDQPQGDGRLAADGAVGH